LQGRDNALLGQQRRIDTAGQVPEIVERGAEPVLEHGRDLPDRGGVLSGVFQQAELDLQGDELLLRAVVQVPLDLPPLGVLRLDQPTALSPASRKPAAASGRQRRDGSFPVGKSKTMNARMNAAPVKLT
jgi:hypothetical protein